MARKKLHEQVPSKLGELVPQHILSKLREVVRENKVLVRGDIIWLSLPQTLWHRDGQNIDSWKSRPFLVADEVIGFVRDISGKCLSPISILGIDLTGDPNLIPGRPHLSVQIPTSKIRSFVWFDTLRTIEIDNVIVKIPFTGYRLQRSIP